MTISKTYKSVSQNEYQKSWLIPITLLFFWKQNHIYYIKFNIYVSKYKGK